MIAKCETGEANRGATLWRLRFFGWDLLSVSATRWHHSAKQRRRKVTAIECLFRDPNSAIRNPQSAFGLYPLQIVF